MDINLNDNAKNTANSIVMAACVISLFYFLTKPFIVRR